MDSRVSERGAAHAHTNNKHRQTTNPYNQQTHSHTQAQTNLLRLINIEQVRVEHSLQRHLPMLARDDAGLGVQHAQGSEQVREEGGTVGERGGGGRGG